VALCKYVLSYLIDPESENLSPRSARLRRGDRGEKIWRSAFCVSRGRAVRRASHHDSIARRDVTKVLIAISQAGLAGAKDGAKR